MSQQRQQNRFPAKLVEVVRILNDPNDNSVEWVNTHKIRLNWDLVKQRRVFICFRLSENVSCNYFSYVWFCLVVF